jgi:hypothetical protein
VEIKATFKKTRLLSITKLVMGFGKGEPGKWNENLI